MTVWRPITAAACVVAVYTAICITPAKLELIRLAPDSARFFYPPFFLYSEKFTTRKVGPFFIGDMSDSFVQKAKTSFGTTPTHEACSSSATVRETLFEPREVCMRTASSFGLAPLFWVVRMEKERVTRIAVFTESTVEL
jgi:hypothetical protein